MKKKIGPFTEVSRETKYRNDWMYVEEARVIRPDKSLGVFGLVYMRSGTTVVALDNSKNVFLVKEFKYAVNRYTVELISGAIEDAENPIDAGIRELREETGYTADKVTYLGVIDPFTTVISSQNHIILAEGLHHQPMPMPTSDGDVVEPFKVPFSTALQMIETGELTHGASCVALLRTARRLQFH